MAEHEEATTPDRTERRGERSDPEGRAVPGVHPRSRDHVAVIPDVDDLEDRYRLLRELRGLGLCVGLEG
jgi:hypothetical protein